MQENSDYYTHTHWIQVA